MTWTYTDPGSIPRDVVRFLVGDTDSTDPQLSDEEIAFLLSQQSNPYRAAALAAGSLAAKFSRQVTKSVGTLSLSLSDKAQRYRDLSAQLKLEAENNTSPPIPVSTAGSIADKQSRSADPDWNGPEFSRHQFDDNSLHGAGSSNPALS